MKMFMIALAGLTMAACGDKEVEVEDTAEVVETADTAQTTDSGTEVPEDTGSEDPIDTGAAE